MTPRFLKDGSLQTGKKLEIFSALSKLVIYSLAIQMSQPTSNSSDSHHLGTVQSTSSSDSHHFGAAQSTNSSYSHNKSTASDSNISSNPQQTDHVKSLEN